MISGTAQKLPCEGHDFGTFRDATIVLLTQTATEGSIWVVEEGPNHLGWRALVGDRGLQLRSRRNGFSEGFIIDENSATSAWKGVLLYYSVEPL